MPLYRLTRPGLPDEVLAADRLVLEGPHTTLYGTALVAPRQEVPDTEGTTLPKINAARPAAAYAPDLPGAQDALLPVLAERRLYAWTGGRRPRATCRGQ